MSYCAGAPQQAAGPDKPYLVLAVVLLRVTQNAVTKAADVSEGGVPLVGQLLQLQHGPVATVCEWSLQQLEDLCTRRTLSQYNTERKKNTDKDVVGRRTVPL